MFKTKKNLILASASPRRQEFLKTLGIKFQAIGADVDETVHAGESPNDFLKRIAFEKAEVVAQNHHDSWILAADTIIVFKNNILGKPTNDHNALMVLKNLAGNTHEVWTGFCICQKKTATCISRLVRTEVTFTSLTDETCRAYVASGEPLDKAGSYAIQGIGGFMVEKIKGSYSNVVGLPLAEVTQELQKLGIITAC